jgi:hypothetical protein
MNLQGSNELFMLLRNIFLPAIRQAEKTAPSGVEKVACEERDFMIREGSKLGA